MVKSAAKAFNEMIAGSGAGGSKKFERIVASVGGAIVLDNLRLLKFLSARLKYNIDLSAPKALDRLHISKETEPESTDLK